MKRAIVYDKNDKSAAGRWWGPGAFLFSLFSDVLIIPVVDVDDMLDQLVALSGLRNVQLEVWCHAYPGRLDLGDQYLGIKQARDDPRVSLLGAKLGPRGTFWIRGCSAFAGPIGHAFAMDLANFMQCRVAAHTFIIGPFQSGLHTLQPGNEPDWRTDEGRHNAESKWGTAISRPGATNTILATQSCIPEGW